MLEHTPRVHAVFLSNARGHRSRADVLVTQTGVTLVSGQILTETGNFNGVRRFAAYEAGGAAGPADAVLVTRLPARNGTARAVAFVGHAELNALDLTGLDAAARERYIEDGFLAADHVRSSRVTSVPRTSGKTRSRITASGG